MTLRCIAGPPICSAGYWKKHPTARDIDDWVAAGYGLALTNAAQGQFREALEIVDMVLEKFPGCFYSFNVQAAILQQMGDADADAALARYREAGAGR